MNPNDMIPILAAVVTVIGSISIFVLKSRASEREFWCANKSSADGDSQLLPENRSYHFIIQDQKRRQTFRSMYGFRFPGDQMLMDQLVAFYQSGASSYSLNAVLRAFQDVIQYKPWLQIALNRRRKWMWCAHVLGVFGWGLAVVSILLMLWTWFFLWQSGSFDLNFWRSLGFLILSVVCCFSEAVWLLRGRHRYCVFNEFAQWATAPGIVTRRAETV